jgi:hypothetical protein
MVADRFLKTNNHERNIVATGVYNLNIKPRIYNKQTEVGENIIFGSFLA